MMYKIYGTKLVLRIAVLITAICLYIYQPESLIISRGMGWSDGIKPLHLIWMVLLIEMLQKFFPQKMMSMGCRKLYKSNHTPEKAQVDLVGLNAWIERENQSARKVIKVWIGIHVVVGLAYFGRVIGESHLVLLSLLYFVLDLVCILFYCPFQSLIMKNRCCVTCRIFNWDAMMTYTPLILVPGFFAWSLIGVALVLLIWWEYVFWKYPQRFFEGSNENLKCRGCGEMLCKVKKPLNFYQTDTWYI